MNRKPPLPVCKAFLVCRQIVDDPKTQEPVLVGLPLVLTTHRYPAGQQLAFFTRWTSAHGEYQVELQLQAPDGTVLWGDSPPEPWRMEDPLKAYDLRLSMT